MMSMTTMSCPHSESEGMLEFVKTFRVLSLLAIGSLSCESSGLGPESRPSSAGPEVLHTADGSPVERVNRARGNPLSSAASPGSSERRFEGSVVERLSAGGYTYVAVADAGVARWVATMGDAPPAGAAVRVEAFAASDDFHSPRLDRDFDRLLFGTVEPVSLNHDHG